MKKSIVLAAAVGVLCFVIGVLVGLLGLKKTTNVVSSETVTLSEISVRVNAGNLEWFNGAEWIIYGSVEELLVSDNMTMEELEEYYYPIIVERIAAEESVAEAESVKASEAASAAEAESIAKAESEAASAAEKDKNTTKPAVTTPAVTKPSVTKPNTTQSQTAAKEDNYEEEDNDSSDNSQQQPEPEPEPEPQPEPEPEPDNSGDGEDLEWSDDIM